MAPDAAMQSCCISPGFFWHPGRDSPEEKLPRCSSVFISISGSGTYSVFHLLEGLAGVVSSVSLAKSRYKTAKATSPGSTHIIPSAVSHSSPVTQ